MGQARFKNEVAFLKDLSALLKKHNASLEVTSSVVGYGGSEADFEFDIKDKSYSNEIILGVSSSRDIDGDYLDDLISRVYLQQTKLS